MPANPWFCRNGKLPHHSKATLSAFSNSLNCVHKNNEKKTESQQKKELVDLQSFAYFMNLRFVPSGFVILLVFPVQEVLLLSVLWVEMEKLEEMARNGKTCVRV